MAGREKSTRIVKKLKANEERYRELFDSINVCVAVYKAKEQGEDFIIKDFNSAAEKVEKVSRRDIIGKSILEVFPGVKDFGIFEVMQRVWRTEVPESFPAKLYKDNRISGWRENYIYKLPSGDIVAVYEDVTEQKKGEKALEEAEKRYKIVADFTYDWEFWRSPEGKMLYVSPACERITGYTPAQFIKDQRLMEKIILPADKDIFAAHLTKIKDSVPDKVIYRIKCKDGDIRWIEHICQPIIDAKGSFLGTRGSNRDITARKQAEEKLEESEDKYRTILEKMDEAYYETDLKGNLTFFNDALPRLMGYTREEMLGMNFRKLVPAGDHATVRDLFMQVYRTGGPSELHRQAHIRKDGSTIYVELSAIPIKNARDEITGFRGVFRDITARLKAEEELHLRAELLDSAKDSIFMLDLVGDFIYANEACYQTRGYTKEEFMSLNIKDIDTPEYAAKADARIAGIVSKEDLVFEVAHQHKGGSIIPVEIHSRTIMHNGQTCLLSVARDITERKCAEEALQKSEEQYRLLAENADDCIWTLDTDLHVTYISPSVRKLRNVEPEEAMMESVADIMTPASLKRVMDELELKRPDIEKGADTSVKLEIEHYRKDGSTIWVEAIIRVLYNDDGKHAGFIGVSRDISERKKAEEALHISEERYRTILEQMNEAYYEMDLKGNLTFFNDALPRLLGYTREEMMGINYREYVPADELLDNQAVYNEVYRTGVPAELHRQTRIKKDGSTIYVERSVFPLRNSMGEITGFRGVARDITARLKAEEELVLRAELLDSANDSIYVMDVDGNILYANEAFYKTRGYTLEEIMSLRIYDFITPEDSAMTNKRIAEAVRNKELVFESAHLRKDGSIIPVEIHSRAIMYNGQTCLLSTARDVTERRKAEQQLQASESKFSAAFMATSDPIVIAELEAGIIIDINPAWESWTGYSRDEAINKSTADLNMWPDREERRRMMKKLFHEGDLIDYEGHLRIKDGQVREVLFSARIIDIGPKKYIFSRAHDVTERNKAEKSLEQINRRLTDIIEFLPDATLAIDTNNKVILWNRAIEQMTGIAASEMIGKGDYAYTIPFYGEARPFLMDLVLQDSESIRSRYPYILRDGDSFISEVFCPALYGGKGAWVFAKASPLHDRDGNIIGVIESIRDVTTSKQAEEALRHSEEQYRLVAENSDDCIWKLDADFNYTYISPSIRKLRGFEPEEAMRQSLKESTAPQSRPIVMKDITEFFKEAARGKSRTSRVEIEQYRKDGTTVWVESVCHSYLDANGKVAGYIGTSRDVTERRAASEALRESQAKYYELLENAGEAILIAQDGLVKFINKRLTEMTGYTAAEFLDSPFIRYVHKDDVDMVNKTHAARMRGEKVEADYVFRVVARDGEIRWAEIHAALVTWAGRPASLTFLSDITESKKAEEALRESESRYNLLAELTDDVVWVLDRDLRMTYISPSIRKLSGFEPETVLQAGFANSLTPESLQKVLHLLEVNLPEIERGVDQSPIIEVEQYRKDGSTIWVELNVKTQRDNTGKFIGFTGTSRDITSRKASERALRESEEKFRNIFEQSRDAIFITDKEGNILDINESLCTLTGYTRDEILVSHLGPTKNTRQMLLSAIEKAGPLRDYEYQLHRKDGTFISVLVSASVRTDRDGNILGYQGIMHDITERKRLEEERQKTARLESIGTLAGGIAHDFNNILGAVIGNISLAKTEIPDGHSAIDLIKDAEKAVMRAKELTRQLLTFSRGGAPVKKRIQLRNTIIDTANFATRGTNVRCRFNVADDLRPADVDEGQISQVIQNLVINARQAMPTGGEIDIASENIILTEEMRLGRSLPLSPGIYIRITVKDSGIGIKPEHLDKIFDPYFTTKQSGSGLGLATCYSIIRNHGGLISVESSPDRGSIFYVYLPASEGPAEHIGKDEIKEAVRLNGKILVMDDEAALRTTISNMLKRLGFENIEVAASGEEALDLYINALQAKQPFDVVILDLTVPGGMGGRETMEKLREVDPKVVAVVSSGYANEAIMADYTKFGFKGVIVKPYTFDELKSTLYEVMDSLKHN